MGTPLAPPLTTPSTTPTTYAVGVVEGVVRGGAKGVANKWEESGRSQGEEGEEGEEEEDAQLLPLKRFFWFCGGRIAFLQVFRSASATGAICLMHHRPPIHSNEIQLN